MRALSLFLLLSAACFSGPVGWYRADKAGPDDATYDARFETLAMSPDGPCDPYAARGDPAHLVIVLVPGVGGDGVEMRNTLPVLLATKPASVFMFRYSPFDARDPLVDRLAAGLTRLGQCSGRVLVLAHSAGGVVSSRAVAGVKAPEKAEGDWLTLITVASPLAGVNRVPEGVAGGGDRPLMRELGLKIAEYPKPAPGVRVVHLRTSAQSDEFMRPVSEHLPNDPKVGSPGAAQFDLPPELDHPASLVYVAKKIADGSYSEWLQPAQDR